MLKTVHLKLLPGVAAECVAWSADGCLSVLAYSEVIVLVVLPEPVLQSREARR